MQKNDAQISGFAVVKKAPRHWIFFSLFFLKKKNPSSLRYLTFGNFSVPKNCSPQKKLLIKPERQKNPENSVYRFGENDLTNYLANFLQDKIKC